MTFDPSVLFETEDFTLIINNDLLNERFQKNETEESEFLLLDLPKRKIS